jgi:hypothetical protein
MNVKKQGWVIVPDEREFSTDFCWMCDEQPFLRDSILFTVESAGRMFSRAVLDTSRTRVRTFGSDDAGHLV